MVIAIALAFRLPALVADFWFDEIYSYERFARRAQSVGDIFFASALKHDNNHQLNTLGLYLLGEQSNWIFYRLPSLVAGLIAVGLAVLIGRRRSRLEGLICGVLVAASHIVVVYSTEARGYAWLLAFSATAFMALDRFLATRAQTALRVFWFAVAAGLAAHPAILQVYLGALLWSGYRLRGNRGDFVWLHAGPLTWIAVWLAFVTRGSLVGGGPPWTWNLVADEALAWTLGYPLWTIPALLAGLAVLTLLVWDTRRLWAAGSDEGLFYLGAIVGPVILMAALAPPYLFPRYFLVALFFLLIVLGRSATHLARASSSGPWIAAGCVLMFVVGNSFHLASLMRERHGNHVAALKLLAGRPPTGRITVTSSSLDQWAELPLHFYADRLGLGSRIDYVPRSELAGRRSEEPPIDWLITASQPCAPAPPAARHALPSGDVYVLMGSFAVCGPSGMSWYLYERSGP